MTPTHLVENTFSPSQFAATTATTVVTEAASTKSDHTMLYFVFTLITLGILYVAWQRYKEPLETTIHKEPVHWREVPEK